MQDVGGSGPHQAELSVEKTLPIHNRVASTARLFTAVGASFIASDIATKNAGMSPAVGIADVQIIPADGLVAVRAIRRVPPTAFGAHG